jgi:hypothetical protein
MGKAVCGRVRVAFNSGAAGIITPLSMAIFEIAAPLGHPFPKSAIVQTSSISSLNGETRFFQVTNHGKGPSIVYGSSGATEI